MEIIKFIVSWSHSLSATLSLILGAMVLFMEKGGDKHRKYGKYYFYLMLVNNITSLFIYNASGKFFFPHWLAVVVLITMIPGFLITKVKKFEYWKPIHIFLMVLSYYMLIGGAINEVYLHVPTLRPLILTNHPSVSIAHSTAMFFFIGLIIFYLVKYRMRKQQA